MPKFNMQWILAGLVPVAIGAHFGLDQKRFDESAFMPGDSSHGHYQIELQCAACHDPDMGVRQSSCLECHQAELDRAEDSHPVVKFADPRNADRLAVLDARKCVTCHQEHQPDKTLPMGLTLPSDYCFSCHQDIADELPDHQGMPFNSCSTTGCHNYHDNSALYEDFLAKHADQPPILPQPRRPARSLYDDWSQQRDREPLAAHQRDVPPHVPHSQHLAYEWAESSHARAGVNCSECHAPENSVWSDRPGHAACQACHADEVESFLQSRHGMRLAQGLDPMTPSMARLPTKPAAAHRALDCASCHSDHAFDTRHASVDACLQCHDDKHSLNYKSSPHFQLWAAESSGLAPAGSGVSCASCHLPRVESTHLGQTITRVLHNQNDTLRPVEKMARPVCIQCHGLPFSLDALADDALLQRNFLGQPAAHVPSIDMVKEKLRLVEAQRPAE